MADSLQLRDISKVKRLIITQKTLYQLFVIMPIFLEQIKLSKHSI